MNKKMNVNLNKTTKSNFITYGIVIIAYVVLQILMGLNLTSSLLEGLLVPLCVYALMAVSLNLTVGILGELSLGHAGFMCIGAFASAFFSKTMTVIAPDMPAWIRFLIALIIGAALAGIFGILIGVPVLRLKGDYLAIVTLAFGEIIKNIISVIYIGKDENGFHFAMNKSSEM